MGYPAYQTVKIRKDNGDIVLYCSKNKKQNHDAGVDWVDSVISKFKYKANQIIGKSAIVSSQPRNAIIY